MKKILFTSLAVLLFITLVSAQKRETRDVSTFTRIAFRTPGTAYVKQGSPQKVEIEGPADVIEKILTKVEDGRLSIGPEDRWMNWSWNSDDRITVYITVASIDGLSVSGSGDMIVETKVNTGNLQLNVSGSGSLKVDATAADVDADVSGSGDMELRGKYKSFSSDVSGSGEIQLNATVEGKADFEISGSGKIIATGSAQAVDAEVSGSGKILASNLETDVCKVRITGSGNVEINVKKELDARITGSGSVNYKGDPARVNADSSGSGKVRKI